MPRELTLGVLSPHLGGRFHGGLLAGITRAAADANATVVAIQTLDAGQDQTEVTEAPELGYPVAWEHVTGLIVINDAVSPRYLAALKEAGKSIVTVSHELAELKCPAVLADNSAGVRDAVRHLIEEGHRRIAFAGHLGAEDVRQRYAAYRDTLRAHGLVDDPALVFSCDDNQEPGGEQAGRALLAAGMPSTAVVAGTDTNAIGIMRVLTDAGHHLPDEQAIVGFDDMQAATYAVPHLSTVQQPVDMLGRTAVAVLLTELAAGTASTAQHRVPTTFVVRDSCGCGRDRLAAYPTESGPSAGARRRLAERLAGVLLPDPGRPGPAAAVLSRAVDSIASRVEAAIRASVPPPSTALTGAVGELFRLGGRRVESLTELSRVVSQFGRESIPADDPPAAARMTEAVHLMILTLVEAQGRAQFTERSYLQQTLSTQHEVSLTMLRAHEDPRQLGWLARTSARAGCLGLWAEGRSGAHGDAALDIAGTFVRDGHAAVSTQPTTTALFPPAELLALAGEHPDDLVLVVPVKVNSSDWGLLAVVDTVETHGATGREQLNQSAALLTVALDHQAVLRELRSQEEQLRIAARYDHLTGLANRSLFLCHVDAAIEGIRQDRDRGFAVLFLDLDGFKVVSDSMGHSAGDRLLVQVAERIKACLRESDLPARFGGDEFLILLDGAHDIELPSRVAERLHAALARPFYLQGQQVVVSTSIGIAPGSARYDRAEDLVRDADIAMYWAKSRRKGSHAIFNVAMHAKAVTRLQTETELRRAIDRDEFEVHYQPIVDLPSGQTQAFEALVRWRHPERGLVQPDEFLPIAEETGLIIPIGRRILDEACGRLAAWQHASGRPDLSMSLNVSNRQFWHGGLVDDVQECLRRTRLAPHTLSLEITEGVIMHNVGLARKLLEDLHGLGCQLHIDDFGTGYSSLEALHRLPIDALKIDRSFVSGLGTDPRSGELVRTIVLMGRNLGLDLIGEGIENPAQREHLLRLECTYGQGYLLSRPVPAEPAAALVSQRH
ncbi:EAL domain-containing protein [Micromonospora sp. NPDC049679]|uniref:EAL domain-containing protein n=1 Tax=Micromonospora sp. NPDC049679 TaxID=3155920 RepID=UPI0034004BCD